MSGERSTESIPNKRPKKRPKKRSKVWKHFNETPDGEEAICKDCNNSLSAKSTGGTSHLNRHHTKHCPKRPNIAVNRPPTLVSSNEAKHIGLIRNKPWEGSVNKSSILSFEKTKIAILKEIPIASSDCRKLWHDLMGPMDIEKETFAYYEHAKEKLAIEFKNLQSRVSISFEIVPKLGYVSITAHFINEDFNLMRKLIGFKKVTDLQSESCIVDAIESCISDWKLGDKIFIFVGGDYLSDIEASLHEKFSSKMLLPNRYTNKPCYKEAITNLYCHHIRHLCHQENANIDKFVKEVKGATRRMTIFNDIAKEKGLAPINIDWLNEYVGRSWDVDSKDVEHWKPLIKMFKEALIYKDVFDEYKERVHKGGSEFDNVHSDLLDNINSSCTYTQVEAGQPPFSELNVCSINWKRVEEISNFSDIFFNIIEELSNSDYQTSNLSILNIYKIQDHIYDLYDKFADYKKSYYKRAEYEELYGLLHIANALDPRFKLEFLGYFLDQSCIGAFKEDIDVELKEIFRAYAKEEKKKASPTYIEVTNTQDQGTSSNSSLPHWQAIADFSNYVKEEVNDKKELFKYLVDELVDLNDASFNPLDWWKQNRSLYPVMSTMARDILAIPACVNSIGGIISSKFELLEGVNPQLVEAVICSKVWILFDMQRPEPNN